MATLSALRDALAVAVGTIDSLNGIYSESPAEVNTPAAVIRPGSPFITYSTSSASGSHDYQFSVLVLVSIAQGAGSSDVLDLYLDPEGPDSVYAAVEVAPTLSGTCDAAVVTSVANAGLVEYGGVQYLGAELLVSVLA